MYVWVVVVILVLRNVRHNVIIPGVMFIAPPGDFLVRLQPFYLVAGMHTTFKRERIW